VAAKVAVLLKVTRDRAQGCEMVRRGGSRGNQNSHINMIVLPLNSVACWKILQSAGLLSEHTLGHAANWCGCVPVGLGFGFGVAVVAAAWQLVAKFPSLLPGNAALHVTCVMRLTLTSW
jgi:hypothetical protein